MSNVIFGDFLKNYTPPVIAESAPQEIRTIKEGDILVAQWGYDANNVNYFQVLRRTKRFVEVAELNTEYVPGETGIFDGRFVKPGTTWKNYSLWADRESYNYSERQDGQPIKFRRMVKEHTLAGDEYALLCEYTNMYLWDGKPKVDYNHH
jgi:hypothetical protein